jgi:hypothetical protein
MIEFFARILPLHIRGHRRKSLRDFPLQLQRKLCCAPILSMEVDEVRIARSANRATLGEA